MKYDGNLGKTFLKALLVCPMEEDSAMLMLSVVISVHMCGREGEKKRAMGG
jgi:hypothetical protein